MEPGHYTRASHDHIVSCIFYYNMKNIKKTVPATVRVNQQQPCSDQGGSCKQRTNKLLKCVVLLD